MLSSLELSLDSSVELLSSIEASLVSTLEISCEETSSASLEEIGAVLSLGVISPLCSEKASDWLSLEVEETSESLELG